MLLLNQIHVHAASTACWWLLSWGSEALPRRSTEGWTIWPQHSRTIRSLVPIHQTPVQFLGTQATLDSLFTLVLWESSTLESRAPHSVRIVEALDFKERAKGPFGETLMGEIPYLNRWLVNKQRCHLYLTNVTEVWDDGVSGLWRKESLIHTKVCT